MWRSSQVKTSESSRERLARAMQFASAVPFVGHSGAFDAAYLLDSLPKKLPVALMSLSCPHTQTIKEFDI